MIWLTYLNFLKRLYSFLQWLKYWWGAGSGPKSRVSGLHVYLNSTLSVCLNWTPMPYINHIFSKPCCLFTTLVYFILFTFAQGLLPSGRKCPNSLSLILFQFISICCCMKSKPLVVLFGHVSRFLIKNWSSEFVQWFINFCQTDLLQRVSYPYDRQV